MNSRSFLEVLKSRFPLILVTLLIAVGTAAVLTYLEPKRYVASTFLLLNFKDGGPFDSSPIPAQLSSSYLETQVDIVRSQKVALKVVEMLELDKESGWIAAYEDSGNTVVPLKEWIATMISANIVAAPLDNSRVVRLSYRALTPDEAARIANAYAQAFIATTLDLTVEPAGRNAAWFDGQLQVLRKRLEAARARMTEFQVEQGIIALDDKLGAETQRLQDISKNLVEAQVATYAARSRQLGVNHPDYVSALQRERAMEQALAQQKSSILRIKGQRDELDALAREVESEQQNYSATLQSYFKTVMESQFNQTNIAVLGRALVPTEPVSPDVALNMISATVLGLILGLAVAFGVEMLSPRGRQSQGAE